jgi:uncharacterized protein
VSGAQQTALPGAVALLTGATGGIGQAIARALAARGARLILSGRRAEALQELAAALDARVLPCDLASREAVAELAREAVGAEVDLLIANAGVPASGVITDLTQDQIDRMLEINLRAPIALARALSPGMVARRHGHLVFISSLQGKAAVPASSVYSAAKFGLRGFALSIRQDLRPEGIGVSTIFPGFIREAGMFADTGISLPPGVGTRSPDEVAAAVIAAIERDRAELDVAPLSLRLGTVVGGLAPELSAAVGGRLGSRRIARAMAERQQSYR